MMWDFSGMRNSLPVYPPPTTGDGPAYIEMPTPTYDPTSLAFPPTNGPPMARAPAYSYTTSAQATQMPTPYHYSAAELQVAPSADLQYTTRERARLRKKRSESHISTTEHTSSQSRHSNRRHSYYDSHNTSQLDVQAEVHHYSHSHSPSRRHHHKHSHSNSPSSHHRHDHHDHSQSHSHSPSHSHHQTSSSLRPSSSAAVLVRPHSSSSRPRPQSAVPAIRPTTIYDLPPHELPPRPPSPESRNFAYSRCSGRRKAVCIGINYTGQSNALRGCINDAMNVYKFLLKNGYPRDNIFVLTDKSYKDPGALPTRENILRAMKWLVQDARPHDSLFFHYSGHGGQTPDLDGDEDDGFDEVIFPLDFKTAGHILDDEMHEIMVRNLPQYVRLTALFDACHSGTALDLPYIYSSHGRLKTNWIKKKKKSAADVISWSACRDDEKSADTFKDGKAVGAMSYAFIQALQAQPVVSYLDLLKAVRRILRGRYEQKPQLGSSHHIDTTMRFVF